MSTMESRGARILSDQAVEVSPRPQSIFEILNSLYLKNFTGTVFLHFRHGTPRVVEYGPMNRCLVSPLSSSSSPPPEEGT